MSLVRHPEEARRVEVLHEFGILDTPPDPRLRSLVELAAGVFDAPVAFISLLDTDRQYIVAEVGGLPAEVPRDPSVCNYAILEEEILEIPDVRVDPRFSEMWPILEEVSLKFYAGVGLQTSEGLPIGTLCVMDTEPRNLSQRERNCLRGFADQAMAILELHREVRRLERGLAVERQGDPAELAESDFLAVITDRLPVRIAYLDPNMRYVFLNGEYERQFGFAPREAWGRTVEEIAGTPAWLAAQPYLERAMTGESSTQEITLPYPFGVRRVEARFVSDIGPGGEVRGVVVHAIDVTARYEAEQERERLLAELGAERERFRSIFEQAPAFLALLRGPRFVVEYANAAYVHLVGGRELIGLTLADALPEVVEQGFPGLLERVIDTGEPFIGREVAVFLQSGPGAEMRRHFLDFVYQPVRDGSGKPYGVLVHGVDVTEQVVARHRILELNEELEGRVQERTRELQEAIRESEGFNYSVAHDLRAPLRAIISTATILSRELATNLSPGCHSLLERQIVNATKMSRLIDELLRLSRLSRVEVTRDLVDLTAMAYSVANELQPDRKIDVQAGMRAHADPNLVRTVIQNLIDNAFKFSPAELAVKVGQTGDVYWVRDQGVGFDMQFSLRVFQPFERLVTEDEFEGTGIGLANVDRIVRRHRGRVWAESEPGRGSTFYFTLDSANPSEIAGGLPAPDPPTVAR